VREKYYLLAEKVWLISQANMANVVHACVTYMLARFKLECVGGFYDRARTKDQVVGSRTLQSLFPG